MGTTAIAVVLAIALILILLSSWTVSSFFYYAILILFAMGFGLDLVQSYRAGGKWDWQATGFDVLFFGFIFYFVTMQKLLGRKVFEIPSGDALRKHFRERNDYCGWHKTLVYLPIGLIIVGIFWAIYWKYVA